MDESSATKKTQMLATAAGEQMKACYFYEEMDILLRKYGFELIEHLDAEKMTDRYFKKYNEANSEYQMRMAVCMNCVRPLYQTTRYEKTIRRFCSTISRAESMQCIILRECRSFCLWYIRRLTSVSH